MNHFDIAFAVEITTEKLAQALREDLEKDLRDISVEEAIATVKATPDASVDRKSTRLNSSHIPLSRMPSSA